MKKIISLSLALTMLIASTACGQEETELSPEAFVSAAEKIVDSEYEGIISSGKNYCSDDDAEDYRKDLKKESFNGEWIIVFDDGEALLFYADKFDKKAKCDGKMPSDVKGMTLEEIYAYYIDSLTLPMQIQAIKTTTATKIPMKITAVSLPLLPKQQLP